MAFGEVDEASQRGRRPLVATRQKNKHPLRVLFFFYCFMQPGVCP